MQCWVKPVRMLHKGTAAGLAIVAFTLHMQVGRSVMDCRMIDGVVLAGILDNAVLGTAVWADSSDSGKEIQSSS